PRGVASVAGTPATCPLVPGEKIALNSVRSSVSRGRLSDGFGTAPYPSASPPGPFPLSLTLRGTKGSALPPPVGRRPAVPSPRPCGGGGLVRSGFLPRRRRGRTAGGRAGARARPEPGRR